MPFCFSLAISKEQTQSVDRWLAGVELYVSRTMAVERRLTYMKTDTPKEVLRQQLLEETRRDSLTQYFRTMDKSLHLRSRAHADSAIPLKEKLDKKPWELDESAHEAFIRMSKNKIHRAIETPLSELHSSIMRHGMEQLNKNLGFDRLKDEVDAIVARQKNGEELSSDEEDLAHNLIGVITSFERWQDSETTLREGLLIDSLKEELIAAREKAMQTGNLEAVGEKEEEIVKKIQHALSAFPFESGRNNPTDIITEQSINCVGASLLAGTFLSELGINYFVIDQPGHSNILVVRSDDTVYVHDMLYPEAVYSQDAVEEKLNGIKSNGEPIKVQDIIVESKHPTGHSLHIRTGHDSLTLHHSSTGHQTQLMFNAAGILTDLGKYHQSVPILRTIVDQDPGNIPALRRLSYGLARMGRQEEAISVGKRAVAFDKNSPDAVYALVDAYFVARNEQEVKMTAGRFFQLMKEQNLTEDPDYKDMSNSVNSILDKLQMN
ncbi:MAG: tetratricopeptide repeat protein [Candidatus Levyibacteriota bacterium]